MWLYRFCEFYYNNEILKEYDFFVKKTLTCPLLSLRNM